MLISGFWHGAAWTFVAWGAVHAGLLSLERITKWPQRAAKLPVVRHMAVLATFVVMLVTWVFFRADSFPQAATIIAAMFRFDRLELHVIRELIHIKAVLVVGFMLVRQVWVYTKLSDSTLARSRASRWLQPVAIGLLIAACILLRGPGQAFIYFQF